MTKCLRIRVIFSIAFISIYLFSRTFQFRLVRPYVLRAGSLFYYHEDAPPPAEPKGELRLRNYALIDLERSRQLMQNKPEEFALFLEPADKGGSLKTVELTSATSSPDEMEEAMEWFVSLTCMIASVKIFFKCSSD